MGESVRCCKRGAALASCASTTKKAAALAGMRARCNASSTAAGSWACAAALKTMDSAAMPSRRWKQEPMVHYRWRLVRGVTGRVRRVALPFFVWGLGLRQASLFFASPKKSKQKKGEPKAVPLRGTLRYSRRPGSGANSLRSNKGRLHPPILQNPRRLKHPATATRPAPEKSGYKAPPKKLKTTQ